MATARDRRSTRFWRLAEGGYVLMEASRTLGGPYPEISLVFGPAPTQLVTRPGRPRTRMQPQASIAQASVDVTRAWWPAVAPSPAGMASRLRLPELGAPVLLMTAPRDAAEQFAASLVERLVAEGHALEDVQARMVLATGAFNPSMVNAALLSPTAGQAFLRDWQAGRVPQLASRVPLAPEPDDEPESTTPPVSPRA